MIHVFNIDNRESLTKYDLHELWVGALYTYPHNDKPSRYALNEASDGRCGFSWTETQEPVDYHNLHGLYKNELECCYEALDDTYTHVFLFDNPSDFTKFLAGELNPLENPEPMNPKKRRPDL